MKKTNARELLEKYRSGNCTEEEKALLESWYLEWQGGRFDLSDKELQQIKRQTLEELLKPREKEKRIVNWSRYVAAATIISVLLTGLFVLRNDKPVEKNVAPVSDQKLILREPSVADKALLTLADGTVLQLDDIANGTITEVNGIRISKTADGQLSYEIADQAVNSAEGVQSVINKISTPRGGQYEIRLPDGSKVWLNAASSLKYPIQFSKTGREVELSGEAYFDVKKLKSEKGDQVPFIVNTGTQVVEVLGTEFNLNCYNDEETVTTTLLEGSVKVHSGSQRNDGNTIVLKPGQQSNLSGSRLTVRAVDTEDVVAWKNGYFSFEESDLGTVMRQLSRWYDFEVEFAGKLPSSTFTGKVYRNMSLPKVLDILSYAGINFKREGNRIIVMP